MRKGRGCDKAALAGSVKAYKRQVIRSEGNLTANKKICDHAQVFLSEINGIQAARKEYIRSAH